MLFHDKENPIKGSSGSYDPSSDSYEPPSKNKKNAKIAKNAKTAKVQKKVAKSKAKKKFKRCQYAPTPCTKTTSGKEDAHLSLKLLRLVEEEHVFHKEIGSR